MSNYKTGLVSVSFRNHSPREILQAAKSAGLECVEWGSDIHAPCDDLERLSELVNLQKEFGIYCSSYGTYFKLGVTELSELPKYISAAKILGTNIIRLFCGDRKSDDYTESEKAEFLSQCRKAAEIAEKSGVTLCMECHNWSFTQTIEGALELMETVNSPNFQMYWQLNQFVSVEENVEYATQISKYVKHIHIFNWKKRDRYPLGDAFESWNKYLNCFNEDKTLLLEFMPDDRIESLEEEAKALFKIAERIK